MTPSYIVELGTFTGYSAICLARGLAKNGKLISIESDAEMQAKTRDLLSQAPEFDSIDFRHGRALDVIPTLDEGIDLAFVDAKKDEYLEYYNT